MSIADDIREFGYARVAPLSPDQVADVLTYLKAQPVYPNCHVTHSAGPPGKWEEHLGANVVCWHMGDVTLAPHLLELALSHTDAVAEYLGVETPLLYSMNAFCTRPSPVVRPDIQDWHRDMDDIRFLPLFGYLTDVGEDGAQHLRTDRGEVTIDGPAGSCFFSDTMREHYGGKPTSGERIVWWARWGVSEKPASYAWDELEPLDKFLLGDRYPTDLRLQHSIRLIAG